MISASSCVGIKKIDAPYKVWVYQLQNASPVELSKLGADIVVIDYSYDGSDEKRYLKEDIEKIKKAGSIVLSYINIGQAEDYRFYWRKSWGKSPPGWIIEEDPKWKANYYIKYWRWGWKEIIYSYIDKVLEEGFDGIYLDRVDAFEYLAGIGMMSEKRAAIKMIEFIKDISNYIRSKKKNAMIVLQNGERILEYDDGELLKCVDGWSVEDLFYSCKGFKLKSKSVIEERGRYLEIVQNAGKFILVVEYIDVEGDKKAENRMKELIEMCKKRSYIPYATYSDRKLNKIDHKFFRVYSLYEPKGK